jgi:uroporphyrinogen III methyltransferase/synthase
VPERRSPLTDRGPLQGRTIVVTRPEHQADGIIHALERLGAEPVALPTIRIQPKADTSELDRALRSLDAYQWLVFTSVNGVRITLDRYFELQLEMEKLRSPGLAAIGPATSRELQSKGLRPDFVPDSFIAEEVAAGVPDVRGASILIPRADGARPVLPEILRARGATVDEIPIYEVVRAGLDPEPLERLQQGVDAIIFTSPSTAENFSELVHLAGLDPVDLPGNPLIACIGPITESAAKSLGYRTGLVAKTYTSQGLVEALIAYYTEDGLHGDE